MCFHRKPYWVEATKTSSLKYSPRLRESNVDKQAHLEATPPELTAENPRLKRTGNLNLCTAFTHVCNKPARVREIHRIRAGGGWGWGQDDGSNSTSSCCGNSQYQQTTNDVNPEMSLPFSFTFGVLFAPT